MTIMEIVVDTLLTLKIRVLEIMQNQVGDDSNRQRDSNWEFIGKYRG